MTPWGQARDDILHALEHRGDMTCAALGDWLGVRRNTLQKRLTAMVNDRRIHIAEWVSEVPGERRYLRARYSFGPGVNARKPKTVRTASRYHVHVPRSVFDLPRVLRHAPDGSSTAAAKRLTKED